jgi:hypothetical protein
MTETKYIIKSTGEHEPFSVEKFQRSLHRAGATPDLINQITAYVLQAPDLKTSTDIYHYAYNHLRAHKPAMAARYNLKNAIGQLGPSGFPFERFVAEIFKQQGYSTAVDQIVYGFCVSHEIDIILKNDHETMMVECKFHQPRLHADVKVPLYIKARFDDIQKREPIFSQAWVVTNTRFTSDAIAYGQCAGLKLLSWGYPEDNNIATMVDNLGLLPITALTTLSSKQKRFLIQKGLVLCRDASRYTHLLQELGFSDNKINQILDEAQTACQLPQSK